MRPIYALGALLLVAGTAWADSLEHYRDHGAWKVFRVVHATGAPECYMRSAVQLIDPAGSPEAGYTFLELNSPGGRVWLSGQAEDGYFQDTKLAIQVDGNAPIGVAFREPIEEPSLVDRMKAGNSAVVTVSNPSGDPTTYTFSLIGFTKALNALAECERTGTSGGPDPP
jgi:hypothetical protein